MAVMEVCENGARDKTPVRNLPVGAALALKRLP